MVWSFPQGKGIVVVDYENYAQAPGRDNGAQASSTDSAAGELPPSLQLAAQAYRKRGWKPIPLEACSKKPVHKNWTQVRTSDDTRWPGNIGLLLGEASGGLMDLDLDSAQARGSAASIL